MGSNVYLDSLLVDFSVDICVGSIFGCSLEFHLEHPHVVYQLCRRSKFDHPEIAGLNRVTDVEVILLKQLLWFTKHGSRKHCMVNCSDSSSHQCICRRNSIELWMDACSVYDKESSY